MNKGGEIFFDDLEIFEDHSYWYFLRAGIRQLIAGFRPFKKWFTFHVYYRLSAGKRRQAASASWKFSTQTKRSCGKNAGTIRHIVETSFGRLPKGKMILKASLLDAKNKVVGASCELPL
ncbi:MAG: hypothetical protein V8T87_06905 [Victivallales bacterium]